jgi:hypothetical protein
MWDLGLLVGAAGLRVIHALASGHAAPALALASSVMQMAWLQLRGRNIPSSRWWTLGQLARIGLCSVVFAALPPGSRLIVSLLHRAARSDACSRLCARACLLKSADLAPTSRLALGKHEL